MYEGDVEHGWRPNVRSICTPGKMTTRTSFRTTNVECMTTVSTQAFVKNQKPPIFKQSTSASATLPQRKDDTSLWAQSSPMRGGKTRFEKLIGIDFHYQRCKTLIEERDNYFLELYAEKQAKDDMDHYSATLIQAAFRGWITRPRRGHFARTPPRSPGLKFRTWKFAPHEIADELCEHAEKLKLSKITGMTLEPRNKASKRKIAMQKAALRRIVILFRMVVARTRAKRIVAIKKQEKNDKLSKRVSRFFRWIFAKSFTRKAMAHKKNKCATVINNKIRQYLSWNRVRILKRNRVLNRREQEAGIVLLRNFYQKRLI